MRTQLQEPQVIPGLHCTALPGAGLTQWHISVTPVGNETPAAMARRLLEAVRRCGAEILRHEIFGQLAACQEAVATCKKVAVHIDWPITCLEGDSGEGAALAGMHVHAISGAPVKTLWQSERPVGRTFQDQSARYCLLGDIRDVDNAAPRPVQAQHAFENLRAALAQADMTMHDVARTWLFMDDVLAWYGDFNKVRTHFFEQEKMFGRLVPASTGIGCRNSAGAALILGGMALRPHAAGTPLVREITSPLQNSALDYGSSFSRAVEVTDAQWRRLLISGTASIDPAGHTVHVGDTHAQVDLTMRVVEALLQSRGMTWRDTTRATAYFKHASYVAAFRTYCQRHELPLLPVICVECAVCRDDLLFELELDARLAV